MSKTILRKIIFAANTPKPVAPYSPAVQVNSLLYVSGQLGIDASQTHKLVDGGVQAQTKQALKNMEKLLAASGSSFDRVVKTTVLMADIKDFASVNEVYQQFFKDPLPARTAFQAAALPLGALVEIEAVAIVGDVETSKKL